MSGRAGGGGIDAEPGLLPGGSAAAGDLRTTRAVHGNQRCQRNPTDARRDPAAAGLVTTVDHLRDQRRADRAAMTTEEPLYKRDPEAWLEHLAEGNAKQARKRVGADAIIRDADDRILLV